MDEESCAELELNRRKKSDTPLRQHFLTMLDKHASKGETCSGYVCLSCMSIETWIEVGV